MESIANPGFFFTIAVFAFVIGLLVFIHEFGHYAVGRMFGMKVETFAVGFGQEILGWTDRHGTRWKLGWIPMGGYAKFAGDMNAASQPDPAYPGHIDHVSQPAGGRTGLFQTSPLWQKTLVVAAGPAINFLFAILIFMALFMTYGQQITPPVVGKVVAGTPAAAADFQTGDRFVSVDGRSVARFEDVLRQVSMNAGTPMEIELDRQGTPVRVTITPRIVAEVDRFGNDYTRGMLGVASGELSVVDHSPIGALGAAVDETWNTVIMMRDTLIQIVTGRRAVEELGGPIKIAQFSGQSASLGLPVLVSFIALISINLGFINLLPIPMLDGGHLFLYALEAVRRRPLHPKVQEWAFMSGFALLMTLMLFLTWNDLQSVGLWDRLAGLVG